MGANSGSREPNPQAVSALPGFDPGRVEAFANAMGWTVRDLDDPSPISFNGYMTLWPPQAQAKEGQTGWLTGHMVSDLGSQWEPPTADEAELGEFPTLERALASLAAWWAEEQAYAEAEAAAYAEGDPYND